MKKTAQEMTMDLLKGESVVIDPVAKILEKEALLKQLQEKFDIAGSDPAKTKGHSFVGEQEQAIKLKRTEYYHFAIESGLADGYCSDRNVFEKFDFKLVVTKK